MTIKTPKRGRLIKMRLELNDLEQDYYRLSKLSPRRAHKSPIKMADLEMLLKRMIEVRNSKTINDPVSSKSVGWLQNIIDRKGQNANTGRKRMPKA